MNNHEHDDYCLLQSTVWEFYQEGKKVQLGWRPLTHANTWVWSILFVLRLVHNLLWLCFLPIMFPCFRFTCVHFFALYKAAWMATLWNNFCLSQHIMLVYIFITDTPECCDAVSCSIATAPAQMKKVKWLGCEGCLKWFHGYCVKALPSDYRKKQWYCTNCKI